MPTRLHHSVRIALTAVCVVAWLLVSGCAKPEEPSPKTRKVADSNGAKDSAAEKDSGVKTAKTADSDSTETVEVKAGALTLTVPKTWKPRQPASPSRVAEFEIPPVQGDAEPAELVVYFFPGGAGGVDANLRRWLGQFDPGNREAQFRKGQSREGEYVLADISGTYNKPVGPPIAGQSERKEGFRMLAVILTPADSETPYFLKLTGPQATVARVAEALRAGFGADTAKETDYEL